MFEFGYSWLNYGLYIHACYLNDIEMGSDTLPFSYIANEEYINFNDGRKFGGEIGVFHFLSDNINLLHNIYISEKESNPLFEIENISNLTESIINGEKENLYGIPRVGRGIFTKEEFTIIKSLLESDFSEIEQHYLIEYNLYNEKDLWKLELISSVYENETEIELDEKSKCILSTYLLFNSEILVFLLDEKPKNFNEVCNFLLTYDNENSERILKSREYILSIESELI